MLLNVLMPVVVDISMSRKNLIILDAFIFVFFLIYKCKGSVASLQFGISNLIKSLPLRSWMLRLLLSVLALIHFLLLLLLRTGTLRAYSFYFLLLRIIYECYKARGAINLFQLNESF